MQTQNNQLPDWNDILKPEEVSIERMWLLFASIVLKDIDKNSVQYSEMRKAYFAGFTECFKIMTDYATNIEENKTIELFSRLANEGNEWATKAAQSQV